jgi:hypothetical protein
MSRAAGFWRVAAAGAALLLAACLAVAAPGSIERYDGPSGSADRAATWARDCLQHRPRPDRALISRCSRVEGRVLYVKREPAETHLAVIARLHLFVVKLGRDAQSPPIGSTVGVVGPLVRARNGLREVQAFAVDRL